MPKKVDVKYLGIPNICFSLTRQDDHRETVFKKQRIERGFDDSETWSLFYTITKFILPRLKCFREVYAGYPGSTTSEEWKSILDKMIRAFELVLRDNSKWMDEAEEKEYQEGMKLFSEWFRGLWW